MSEALPCPFCGTEPLRCYHPPHDHSEWVKRALPSLPAHPGCYTIECAHCGAGMCDDDGEKLLARWNRRQPLPPPPEADDREGGEGG